MKVLNVSVGFVLAVLLLMGQPLFAQPTFQVWSPDWDSISAVSNPDEDSWIVDGGDAFELWAIGAYHNETSLQECQLLISFPDGQQGSISITGLNGTLDPLRALGTPRARSSRQTSTTITRWATMMLSII